MAAHTPFDLGIDYAERSTAPDGTTGEAEFTYRIEMPWRIGAGIAWEPSADFTLALDVEARLFHGRRNLATGEAGTEATPLSACDENLTPVRLGAEYRLRVGSLVFPLRAGIRSVPTLYADRQDGKPVDPAAGLALTGGLGLLAGRLRVDLAYSHSRYDRESITAADRITTTRTYQTVMLQVALGLGPAAAR